MKTKTWIALALACAAGNAAWAQTPEQRMAQLESRIQSLEAELRQYRQNQVDAATIDKVLADAKARSGLSMGKVGYSNGYFLADEQNNFQIKLNGFLQTRYIYNHNDSTSSDNNETGFQIRRAELYLTGNAFNQKLFYQYAGGFDRSTSNFTTVSAYAGYQFNKQAEIRAGTFKPPFMVEELTSAARQQAVERSFVNAFFTAGTSDGVQVQYSTDDYRLAVMVHDGTNALSSEFSADKTDVAIAARGEWKLAGAWAQFADFEGWDDSKFAARLGGAIDYEFGENGDSASNPDFVKYTVDLTVEGRGWNVFLAGVGKHTTDDDTTTESLDQYGLLAQGGVFVIPNRIELFGRYEHICLDGVFATSPAPVAAIDDHVNLLTAGVNWFLIGHNAKFCTDVIYVFNELPAGNSGLGLLTSEDGPQFVLRSAFHLMF